ncbi:MAG: L-threonylcarbamoyladenylate synthase [Thermomicrobiales bacterium]
MTGASLPDPDTIAAAVRDLLAGRVVGLPTDTVYGLAAALHRPAAIAELYAIKGRPGGKPLPVLLSGMDAIELVAKPVSIRVAALLSAIWPGGLTVALPARDGLPTAVVAADGTVGVRVPANDVTLAVLRGLGGAAAVTSANVSGEPPVRTAVAVRTAFGTRLGTVLDGESRPGALPSTVVGFDGDRLVIHREGAIPGNTLRAFWDATGNRGPAEDVAIPGPGTVR